MSKLTIKPVSSGRLYLLRGEWPGLLFISVVTSLVLFITYFINSVIGTLVVLLLFALFLVAYLTPSSRRANFIKNGGYFEIENDTITKIEPNGKAAYFNYRGRRIWISRKKRSCDILLGGTMADFVGQFGGGTRTIELFSVPNEQVDIVVKRLSLEDLNN